MSVTCCLVFQLFPWRTNVGAVICTILYGFCFKTIHSCILVVEREKGKVKEVFFANRLGCGKTCLSFCENFLTVLQENSVSCTAEVRVYVWPHSGWEKRSRQSCIVLVCHRCWQRDFHPAALGEILNIYLQYPKATSWWADKKGDLTLGFFLCEAVMGEQSKSELLMIVWIAEERCCSIFIYPEFIRSCWFSVWACSTVAVGVCQLRVWRLPQKWDKSFSGLEMVRTNQKDITYSFSAQLKAGH